MPGELVLKTLGNVWMALRDRGIDACVMGGLAIVHWGHGRYTQDVDLLAQFEPATIDTLIASLVKEGLAARWSPALKTVGKHTFLQLLFTPKGRFDEIPVDVLLADSEFLRLALQRAIPFEMGIVEAKVVQCEDLIVLKLQADRLLDRIDVQYLLQYNRESLDFAYLVHWIDRLGLRGEWDKWWEEAFPGEHAP